MSSLLDSPAGAAFDVCPSCGAVAIGIDGTQLALLGCPLCQGREPTPAECARSRQQSEAQLRRIAQDEYGHHLHPWTPDRDSPLYASRAVCRRCGAHVGLRVRLDGTRELTGSATIAHCGQEAIT